MPHKFKHANYVQSSEYSLTAEIFRFSAERVYTGRFVHNYTHIVLQNITYRIFFAGLCKKTYTG